MARLGNKNTISGMVGNLVFRDLDGRQVLQSRPDDVKQSPQTRASSSEFQQCSRWAKHLRNGLSSFLMGQTDSYMYRRLTGRVYNALLDNTHLPKGERGPLQADMKALTGFEFNTHSPFGDYFLPEILVVLDDQRQIRVTVPGLEPETEIRFPEMATQAELVVYVYATNFESNPPATEAFFTLSLNRAAPFEPETPWTSPTLPAGHFVLVTAKVLYSSPNKFMGKSYSNSKVLNPCRILFSNAFGE